MSDGNLMPSKSFFSYTIARKKIRFDESVMMMTMSVLY